MSQNYIYTSTNNNKISITTFGNENLENKNCIIFVHGFKGFKDWGFIPYQAKYFSEKGYFVITFNFSHNGIGENPEEFTELDKFAENTYSLEVSELNEIILAYKNGFFGKTNNNTKLGLIGHSRGGAISILSSFYTQKVDALVTWASVSNFERYTERQITDWKKKGYFEVLNSRTNQIMKLNISFLHDIERNKDTSLNIKNALRAIKIPHLIIHGTEDLAVKIDEAEHLYKWSDKKNTELLKINGTGHTFDIKHPFENSSKAFDKVLVNTKLFFSKYMEFIK